MMRKGILLAGGTGSRLHPLTIAINKHFLQIYDKPMIHYSLSLLMLAGIREIVLVSSPDHLPAFRKLFASVEALSLSFEFVEQSSPRGVADAFIVAEKEIEGRETALVLGDNILFGTGLSTTLQSVKCGPGATIFAYPVNNPSQFGVVQLDSNRSPIALVEKPENPKSRLAIPGLYFFDDQAVELTKTLTRSERDELEITDLNRCYLERGLLRVEQLGRGVAWLDAGTFEGLLDAANFVAAIEHRQGFKIGCIEEIAWRNGWIDESDLARIAKTMPLGNYRRYLETLRFLETDHTG